jgi:hypothetical protein
LGQDLQDIRDIFAGFPEESQQTTIAFGDINAKIFRLASNSL